MRCTLISFFDSTNLGDLTLSACLKKQLESHKITVVNLSYSSNIENITNINNIPDRPVKDIMGAKHYIKKVIVKTAFKKTWYQYLAHKEFFNVNNKLKFENHIKQSDFVVIGGGNMVFDIFPYSVSAEFLKYLINIISKYNKKVLILSIGIGPFDNKYQLKKCVEVLSKADVLTFRDEKSERLYFENCTKNIKFINKEFLSADPAFLLEKKDHINKKKNKIAINIINPYLIYNNRNDINKIKQLYMSLISTLSEKYDVEVFATEKMDYEFIQELSDEYEFAIKYIDGLDDLLNLYTSVNALIGSRMHSIIIGLTQKIPFYGLIWQTKVGSIINMFDLSEYSCDILTADYKNIIDKIEKILNSDNDYEKKINFGLDLMRKRLSLNDIYIKTIINSDNVEN